MAEWDVKNLPEQHELISNVSFVTKTKDSWKTKDGTMRDKWGLITQETDDSPSFVIETFSSTDNETIENNTPYDVIVKKTQYGMSLKGYAKHGEPIPIKESTSRFNKSLEKNDKHVALQCASAFAKSGASPDDVILVAEVLESWLKNEYDPVKLEDFKK
jgi:hypothetical protein